MALNTGKLKELDESRLAEREVKFTRSDCFLTVIPKFHPDARSRFRKERDSWRAKNGFVGRKADKDTPEEGIEECLIRTFCLCNAKGWREVLDESGTPVPFSGEFALDIAEKFSGFRDDIVEFMGTEDLDQTVEDEVLEGNS